MVTFRKFKVGDLFDCSTTKSYNPNQGNLPNGDTPYVTRSAFNNGISGYFTDESEVYMNSGNCITIGAEGGIAFYQPDDFIAGIKVYTLRHERMNSEIGMYLCGALNIHSQIYSYTNARILDKIKNELIQLPVKPGTDEVNYTEDDIDWDYMESYIHDLEQSYIHDLEQSYIHDLDAYLQETGLNDYTLTDDEQALLEHEPMFREFKVCDLFDGSSGDTDIKKEHLNGEGYPVITAGVDNLGVAGYSSINAKILPENSLTVDMFGNCCFRPFEYKMVTHSRVFALTLKNRPLTQEAGLFICTMLKWLQSKYNYSNMCTYNKIKNEIIQLPVKPGTDEVNYTEDDIDWDYMESYIRVIEKQVIADVVDYKESVITTAKEIVYV